MIYTKLLKEYANEEKQLQFTSLSQKLNQEFGQNDERTCLLVGNFKSCHFDFDAIMFTEFRTYLFEFKSEHGLMVVERDGWYCGDNKVWSGYHAKNPFKQMHVKRNMLFGWLRARRVMMEGEIMALVCTKEEVSLVDTVGYTKRHPWFGVTSLNEVVDLILADEKELISQAAEGHRSNPGGLVANDKTALKRLDTLLTCFRIDQNEVLMSVPNADEVTVPLSAALPYMRNAGREDDASARNSASESTVMPKQGTTPLTVTSQHEYTFWERVLIFFGMDGRAALGEV